MAEKYKLTVEGLEKIKNELEELKKEQLKNMADLKEARDQGDLSENADYDAARDKQAQIAGKIAEKENIIKNVVIITGLDKDNNLGKKIKVRFLSLEEDDDEDVAEYYLVGTIETNPSIGKISDESPLGKAILQAKVGDIVLVRTELGSQFEVEILAITSPKAEEPKAKKSKK